MLLILLFLAPSDYTALKIVLQTPIARQLIVSTFERFKRRNEFTGSWWVAYSKRMTVNEQLRDSEVCLIYSVVYLDSLLVPQECTRKVTSWYATAGIGEGRGIGLTHLQCRR